MTDLRKLSEAADNAKRDFDEATAGLEPGEFPVLECIARDIAASEFHDALEAAYRSGSLIPRSEYERVLALLAEAREALKEAREELEEYEADATGEGYNRPSLNATLSRIDDALAAEQEAKS